MAENATTETAAPDAAIYYVETPRGNIYKKTAQGRSDSVARGARDITNEGGAEKFAAQHGTSEDGRADEPAAEQAATDRSPAPATSAAGSGSEQAARPAATGRAQRTGGTDQADDTAKA